MSKQIKNAMERLRQKGLESAKRQLRERAQQIANERGEPVKVQIEGTVETFTVEPEVSDQ